MSGPNTQYDPVEVAALDPAAIEQAVQGALAAITAASNLDELKTVRTAHQGDKSPLALANREIGALPPTAKAEAGKRVGQARGQVGAALKERQSELEAERDERILVEEAVDVTMISGRNPLGRRHPTDRCRSRPQDPGQQHELRAGGLHARRPADHAQRAGRRAESAYRRPGTRG